MQRVLVIGSGGAGKSSFATRLAERTGLPLIHLDAIYWRPGWVPTPKREWESTVARLAAGGRWIMDGNFGGTMEMRIAACDTVIFLDLPRTLCLARAVRRRIRFHGRTRPDLTAGCPERLTWHFVRWVWSYPTEQRPRVLRHLAALRPDQRGVVLRSPREAEAFMEAQGVAG